MPALCGSTRQLQQSVHEQRVTTGGLLIDHRPGVVEIEGVTERLEGGKIALADSEVFDQSSPQLLSDRRRHGLGHRRDVVTLEVGRLGPADISDLKSAGQGAISTEQIEEQDLLRWSNASVAERHEEEALAAAEFAVDLAEGLLRSLRVQLGDQRVAHDPLQRAADHLEYAVDLVMEVVPGRADQKVRLSRAALDRIGRMGEHVHHRRAVEPDVLPGYNEAPRLIRLHVQSQTELAGLRRTGRESREQRRELLQRHEHELLRQDEVLLQQPKTGEGAGRVGQQRLHVGKSTRAHTRRLPGGERLPLRPEQFDALQAGPQPAVERPREQILAVQVERQPITRMLVQPSTALLEVEGQLSALSPSHLPAHVPQRQRRNRDRVDRLELAARPKDGDRLDLGASLHRAWGALELHDAGSRDLAEVVGVEDVKEQLAELVEALLLPFADLGADEGDPLQQPLYIRIEPDLGQHAGRSRERPGHGAPTL